MKSSRIYIRECTLVSAYPLLLFGGEIDVQHTEQLLTVDNIIKFKAYAKTGVIFKEIRKLLDDLLAAKLDSPDINLAGNKLLFKKKTNKKPFFICELTTVLSFGV